MLVVIPWTDFLEWLIKREIETSLGIKQLREILRTRLRLWLSEETKQKLELKTVLNGSETEAQLKLQNGFITGLGVASGKEKFSFSNMNEIANMRTTNTYFLFVLIFLACLFIYLIIPEPL